MIGMLTGTVALKTTTYLLLNLHGVGYKVLVPIPVLSRLVLNEEATLYTHTHVREDLLELYGFSSLEDLRLFEYLIGVSGVGCKSALGIFSNGNRGEIVNAVITGDVSFFTSVPRLGKKNAQKIIIELKNKLGGVDDLDLSSESAEDSEAISALVTFGFTPREADSALRSLNGEAKTIEEKVKLALKYLGK